MQKLKDRLVYIDNLIEPVSLECIEGNYKLLNALLRDIQVEPKLPNNFQQLEDLERRVNSRLDDLAVKIKRERVA